MTTDEALALYDADPHDPRVDEAIEYAGQIPDNVRHLRAHVAAWLVLWHRDNG